MSVLLNRFDHGITNDIRSQDSAAARLLKNFDISFGSKLVPYRSGESGQDTITRHVKAFNYASGTLWGLGDDNGGGSSYHVTIYNKTDFSDGTWSITANNVSGVAVSTIPTNCFVYYHGYLYGFHGTQSIFKYDTTGSAAFVDQDLALGSSATVVNQGLVHSKDDILYIPWDNKIATNNNGSWTAAALTLPNMYQITAITEYGNYLAIACRNLKGSYQPSRVFLWDRDSSGTTLAESIDWGTGDIRVIEELEGSLIGISFLTDATQNGAPEEKIIVRRYAGAGGAQQLMQFTGSDPGGNATGIYGYRQKINNKVYFLAALFFDGVYQNGLWSFGRTEVGQPLSLTMERSPNNDTAVTSLQNFYIVGSYTFIAYDGAGAISKTNNAGQYTATSIWETTKQSQYGISGRSGRVVYAHDPSTTKKLVGITIMHEPLDANAQVVVKYKKDAETSWTTILTSSTDNALSKSAVNIETTGANLLTYKEIQFRVESTAIGVADSVSGVITGLKFLPELVSDDLY